MQYACHRLVSIVIVVVGIFVVTVVGICHHLCRHFSHQCSHPICCNYHHRYRPLSAVTHLCRRYRQGYHICYTFVAILSSLCSLLWLSRYRHVTVFITFWQHFVVILALFLPLCYQHSAISERLHCFVRRVLPISASFRRVFCIVFW